MPGRASPRNGRLPGGAGYDRGQPDPVRAGRLLTGPARRAGQEMMNFAVWTVGSLPAPGHSAPEAQMFQE
jgi:hypothetical protein